MKLFNLATVELGADGEAGRLAFGGEGDAEGAAVGALDADLVLEGAQRVGREADVVEGGEAGRDHRVAARVLAEREARCESELRVILK